MLSFRKFLAILCATLAFLQPIQAHAFLPALALMAPETLGLAIAGTAVIGGAAAYYAPKVYEAGSAAVTNAVDYAHKAYAVYSFANALGQQVLYGKAVQAYNGLDDLGKYIGSNLPQFPVVGPIASASSTYVPASPTIGEIGKTITETLGV